MARLRPLNKTLNVRDFCPRCRVWRVKEAEEAKEVVVEEVKEVEKELADGGRGQWCLPSFSNIYKDPLTTY